MMVTFLFSNLNLHGCWVSIGDGFDKVFCSMQILGRDSVYYFHDMIIEMIKWGFQEGKTLFGFGYDFRQSNRYMLNCKTLLNVVIF